MDFDHAIEAHTNWKRKLRSYLAKPDHSLTASEVAQDDKCDVGKWIAGEGKTYAGLPEFQTLRSEDARFHKTASDVIHHADSGRDVTEEVALGGSSEFSSASSAVVSALMAMKAKIVKQMAGARYIHQISDDWETRFTGTGTYPVSADDPDSRRNTTCNDSMIAVIGNPHWKRSIRNEALHITMIAAGDSNG